MKVASTIAVCLVAWAGTMGAMLASGPAAGSAAAAAAAQRPVGGQVLYEVACAACHAADGTGAPIERVAFDIPLPDFTDCSFATREPDADWLAVVHDGGPGSSVRPDHARLRRCSHRRRDAGHPRPRSRFLH